MRVKYHQNKNGVGELNEVSNIQMSNLEARARGVEKEEVIGGQKTTVKATIKMPKKLFDEFGNLCVGEE